MQKPSIQKQARQGVYEQSLSFALCPLIPVLFALHPALLFSDCPTPEARAGICLCWRSSEHTESISGHRGACPVPLAAIDISLSVCSPLLLGQRVVLLSDPLAQPCRAIRWLEKSHMYIHTSRPISIRSHQDYYCAYIQFMQLGWTLSLPTLSDCLVFAVY